MRRRAGFDRIVIIATSPTAVTACTRIVQNMKTEDKEMVQVLTWLDIA